MSVAIPSQAAIVVDRAPGSSRRSSVESITTTLTDQQPLQQGWFDGTSGRKPPILLELLLRQGEGRFADQGLVFTAVRFPLVEGDRPEYREVDCLARSDFIPVASAA